MKFGDLGCACIEYSEGKCNFPYKDSAGKMTIGIGHLIKPGERFSTLSDDECYNLLKQDVSVAEDDVNRMVKVPLTQNQFDALVCLVFNIGGATFFKSSVLSNLNEGNYQEAANRFLLYNKERIDGELVENNGLKKRRDRERSLFLREEA